MAMINNPFSYMLSVFDPDLFFGRDQDLVPILRGMSSREPRSFALHGVKTIGKTSLIQYLLHPDGAQAKLGSNLEEFGVNQAKRIESVYLDCYAISSEDVFSLLCRELSRSKGANSNVIPNLEEINALNHAQSKELLYEILTSAELRGVRYMICLDHFDSAFETMSYDDDIFLRGLTQRHAFVIATERQLPELRQARHHTSPLIGVLRPRNIGLLTEAEATRLIEVPAEGVSAPFLPSEVAFLLKLGGRQPYLLAVVCEYFFNFRLQYPSIKDFSNLDASARQQLLLQLETLPTVNELFSFLADRINVHELDVLRKIGAGKSLDMDREQMAIRELIKKCLIYENILEGQYFVFSDLFGSYLLRQKAGKAALQTNRVIEHLSPLDRKLFENLIAHPNEIRLMDDLLREVWGSPDASKRALEGAIHRIRLKVQELEGTRWEYIENVRGKGYKYTPQPPERELG